VTKPPLVTQASCRLPVPAHHVAAEDRIAGVKAVGQFERRTDALDDGMGDVDLEIVDNGREAIDKRRRGGESECEGLRLLGNSGLVRRRGSSVKER
jgi:hypothetical protein